MFKQILLSAAKLTTNGLFQKISQGNYVKPTLARNFTSLLNNHHPILENVKPQMTNTTTRTLIKYSYRKGKRKSVKAVLRRFYRLHWGAWIRTKIGRQKKLWKKNPPQKRRLRQHVLCNSTQSWMLDKMTGPYWRKRKYYIDDPYEPYHSREEWQFSSTKPRPYYPPEEDTL